MAAALQVLVPRGRREKTVDRPTGLEIVLEGQAWPEVAVERNRIGANRRNDDGEHLELHARRGSQHVRLAERQETELGPFIVRAESVNWAIEWHRSVVALVRQDARADRTPFRQASALFVSDPLRIGEWRDGASARTTRAPDVIWSVNGTQV